MEATGRKQKPFSYGSIPEGTTFISWLANNFQMSEAQTAVKGHRERAGHGYLVSSNIAR